MLNVFISHKNEDKDAAAEIHRLLELYSTNAEIFSSTRMEQGQTWRNDIVNAARNADWFILIYKSPSLRHDWCLFEAGQFEANSLDENNVLKPGKRLFCLHPEGIGRPSELEPYQSVPATRKDISDLLRMFFSTQKKGTETPGILRTESKEDFDNMVEKIRNIVVGETPVGETLKKQLFYNNSIVVNFCADDVNSDADIPDNAVVEGSKRIFHDLFNLELEQTTWGALKNVGRRQNDIWMREIAKAINFSRRSSTYPPIVAIAQDDDNIRRYRPSLLRTDKLANNNFEAEVIFSNDGTWTPDSVANEKLANLINGVLLSLRWHEEMLAVYSNSIEAQQNRIGPKKLKENMRWVLFSIVKESEAKGLLKRAQSLSAFDNPDDITKLNKIYDVWETESGPAIWNGLAMDPADDVWTEFDDTPISGPIIEDMQKHLAIIKEISSDYLKIATSRLLSLVEEEY
jgi:hypothetical protein